MKPTVPGTILLLCAACPVLGQTAEAPPKFDAADVRVSPKAQNMFTRNSGVHNGRYEVKQATMVDLIHIAYNIDSDEALGGPSWLEMDRFDVIAKVRPNTSSDDLKTMLQGLLADRFKLVIHKDTKPLPAYALVVGKKPQVKQADGTEESGCKPRAQAAPAEGGVRLMTTGTDGRNVAITLGPGGDVQWACRNITMAAFAAGLPRMIGAQLGPRVVLDETGLKGGWNFDVHWSAGILGLMGANQGEHITLADAIEKQLGLKFEDRQVPTPVMVVDSVAEKPAENPPGTADLLPVIPAPTEFEVASVKPSEPGGRAAFRGMNAGRFAVTGMPLSLFVSQAFNANNDDVVGLPAWADNERFDITAKAPADAGMEALAPMLRSLLVDRFKMTYHTEERPVTAYSLTAAKPKMKKADPASRASCKNAPAPPGDPAGSRMMICQNITMAQFADRLQHMAPELTWPVTDATGLEGGWDFTLTYAANFNFGPRGGGGVDGGPGGAPAASDPNGGLTLFEALEKELGLKLEKQKRPMPVTVIDHIEQKPTEN